MASLHRDITVGPPSDLPRHRLASVGCAIRLLGLTEDPGRHAETINAIIKDAYVPTMLSVQVDDKTYGPPSQIPWSVWPGCRSGNQC